MVPDIPFDSRSEEEPAAPRSKPRTCRKELQRPSRRTVANAARNWRRSFLSPSLFSDEFSRLEKQCFPRAGILFRFDERRFRRSARFGKMIAPPDKLTETPERSRVHMDILDEILSSLRLSGGVVIDGEFSGDYCVLAQFTPDHFAPFFPEPERSSATIMCARERCWSRSTGCRRRSSRRATSRSCRATTRICCRAAPALARRCERGRLGHRGRRPSGEERHRRRRRRRCGAASSAPPRTAATRCSTRCRRCWRSTPTAAKRSGSTVRCAFWPRSSPSPDIVARLAELFLAQAVREYVEHLPPGSTAGCAGWSTRRCPRRCRSSTHAMPRTSTSRGWRARRACHASVLGERFVELIGEPPMRYCARWRMRIAAEHAARQRPEHREHRLCRRLRQRSGVQPRVQARISASRRRAGGGASRSRSRRSLSGRSRSRFRRSRCVIATRATARGSPIRALARGRRWSRPPTGSTISNMIGTVRCGDTGSGSSRGRQPDPLRRARQRLERLGHAGLSLDAFVDDLATVVDTPRARAVRPAGDQPGRGGRDRLCGSQPGSGRKLVICNGYAEGWAVRADADGGRAARGDADADRDRLGRGQSRLPPAVHQPSMSRARAPSRWAGSTRCSGCRPRPRMPSGCNACWRARRPRAAAVGAHPDLDLPFARGPGGALQRRAKCWPAESRARRSSRWKAATTSCSRASPRGACSATCASAVNSLGRTGSSTIAEAVADPVQLRLVAPLPPGRGELLSEPGARRTAAAAAGGDRGAGAGPGRRRRNAGRNRGSRGSPACPQKWKSGSPGWPIGHLQMRSLRSSRLVLSATSGLGLAGTRRRGGAGGIGGC